MLRRAASVTLGWASAFLAIIAMLLNSPALFFMTTALIITLIAARAQAFLAVRGLQIQRWAPPTAMVGESVVVEVAIASVTKIQRPLVRVVDGLPLRFKKNLDRPAVPVAPLFGKPVITKYTFRPHRRGVYKWSDIEVISSDALGLSETHRHYALEETSLTILPKPLAFQAQLSFSAGRGEAEGRSSQRAATGTSIRGIRDYVAGDPLRHIHWRASAHRGALLVKEFEVDTDLRATVWLPLHQGDDVGDDRGSILDDALGYALFLAEKLWASGAEVAFPQMPGFVADAASLEGKVGQLQRELVALQSDRMVTMGQAVEMVKRQGRLGRAYVFLSRPDPDLPRVLSGSEAEILVLDPREYAAISLASALDAGYRVSLERSGARVHSLPRGSESNA